jgi:hypothetical protein
LLLCWRLAMRFMTPGWAGVAATVALALYRLPTYNYNHMYAAVVGLLALEFACRAQETRRAGWWAASGAMIGLLCPFKLNVGVQAGAALVAFLVLRRVPRRSVLVFAASALGLVAAQNLFLLAWLGWDALPVIYAPQFARARRLPRGGCGIMSRR